jgi:hypothetical protein
LIGRFVKPESGETYYVKVVVEQECKDKRNNLVQRLNFSCQLTAEKCLKFLDYLFSYIEREALKHFPVEVFSYLPYMYRNRKQTLSKAFKNLAGF